VFLGYRRIVEDAQATSAVFADPRYLQALAGFREVLVYAPAWVERDTGELTGLPCPQRHVGFVCRAVDQDRVTARSHLGVREGLVVASSFGGGRDAWPLVEQLLAAWRSARRRDARLLVYCGPMMQTPLSPHELSAFDDNVSLIRDSAHFPVGAAAADGVISTAGYNSLLEVIRLGRPLWAIPNQPRECEQQLSAQRFATLGMAKVIAPVQGLPRALQNALADIEVRHACGAPEPTPPPPDWFDGDVVTARLLLANLVG
jgi:predicted glycosyltransferase